MLNQSAAWAMVAVWGIMAAGYWQQGVDLRAAHAANVQLVQAHKAEREAWATIHLTVTAYTPSEAETDDTPTQTAIMERPVPGATCAVSRDMSHLLGKTVYVDGIGVLRVNDLMHRRYAKRLDVAVGSKKAARKHGVSEKKVVVL